MLILHEQEKAYNTQRRDDRDLLEWKRKVGSRCPPIIKGTDECREKAADFEYLMHRNLQVCFVLKTPSPILAALQGFNNRMLAGVKMRSRVFIFRVVAAADVTAGQADSQVHP